MHEEKVFRFYLPELYMALNGKTKKRFAWAYLKKYRPEFEPLKVQPELESNNCLLCVFNPEVARQQTREVNERRDEAKRLKKAKKKK